jgi:hypothetical protein|tara:strand:- start:613 stop:975 length:363 start_codon:yes stop_codon:yes gene_type:complete
MITSTTSHYKSSTINSATYDVTDQTLTVVFKWATYVYEAVDVETWNKFNLADSQGKALNEHIKGSFEYAKYEAPGDQIPHGIKYEESGMVKNITAPNTGLISKPGSLLDELPPSDYQMGN